MNSASVYVKDVVPCRLLLCMNGNLSKQWWVTLFTGFIVVYTEPVDNGCEKLYH
jgi:hypothetical protein